MATSICKAQIPLSCQLCNLRIAIQWKCTECELLMCDNCKNNVHSRIKTAEKHNIITILEIGKDLSERLKALQISEVFSSVFNAYTTELPGIHKLICCADDIIYFLNSISWEECSILKAKLLKASMKIFKKMDIQCVDFAISFNEEILFAPLPGSKLIAVTTTTMETKTVLDVSPNKILAIYMSKHNELLIGLRDNGKKFPVTDSSTRQVAIFGTDYKHRSTFERDGTGKRLFNYARRITTDSANNIYVIDWINDDDDEHIGRVVSINRNGSNRFVYNGCASFNTHEAAFNPEDIAVSSRDTTIISDCDNHALHVLSANGELIGLQITKNFDILYPCSLCIDNEGFLLIGSNVNKNAKIYVVKL
ncbi:uncharacterized protein LOC127721550 [Mytilus californianus]|uniref:uncharacterized protein LOC127721550 n=1 Tax=Mytilus californianus TaxID=6549 RepID=UPI0022474F94|nr:uncharacterized protein LOC127721550 [Mytilus californianus]